MPHTPKGQHMNLRLKKHEKRAEKEAEPEALTASQKPCINLSLVDIIISNCKKSYVATMG